MLSWIEGSLHFSPTYLSSSQLSYTRRMWCILQNDQDVLYANEEAEDEEENTFLVLVYAHIYSKDRVVELV